MKVMMDEIGNREKIFLTDKILEEKDFEYKRLRIYAGYDARKRTGHSGENYCSS